MIIIYVIYIVYAIYNMYKYIYIYIIYNKNIRQSSLRRPAYIKLAQY